MGVTRGDQAPAGRLAVDVAEDSDRRSGLNQAVKGYFPPGRLEIVEGAARCAPPYAPAISRIAMVREEATQVWLAIPVDRVELQPEPYLGLCRHSILSSVWLVYTLQRLYTHRGRGGVLRRPTQRVYDVGSRVVSSSLSPLVARYRRLVHSCAQQCRCTTLRIACTNHGTARPQTQRREATLHAGRH
jgi:hypothetical protein